jgi:hypothetical protein
MTFTVPFPVKAVSAAFISPDFFKSANVKATINGEQNSKYKIDDHSGVILGNMKNRMLVRTLRFPSMMKEDMDAVSIFSYTANEEGTGTVVMMHFINVPDDEVAELKILLKSRIAALKTFLAPAPKEKKAPTKRAAANKTVVNKTSKPRSPRKVAAKKEK